MFIRSMHVQLLTTPTFTTYLSSLSLRSHSPNEDTWRGAKMLGLAINDYWLASENMNNLN